MEILEEEKNFSEAEIEEAAEQIEGFFLFLEEGRKEKSLRQYRNRLAEQKAMRCRWKRHGNENT